MWDADAGRPKQEFYDQYKQLATFKATEDSRLLTLGTPDAYEAKLPDSFKAPEGFENYKPDTNHPLMAQARQFIHNMDTHKLSGQAAFSKLLELSAAREIGTAQMLRTARDAEIAKLGANGTSRVTAVENFISAQVGDDLFKATKPLLATAAMVQVWEKIMATVRGQGAGTYTPGRSPAEPAKVDDATWNKMSYSEKKDYASKFGNGRGA